VVYFAATAADQYRGLASVENKPRLAPLANVTPPAYDNYPAPDGLGTRAGEPSIGVNWNTDNVFFQSYTQTLRVSFDDSIAPAAATWADKSGQPPSCTAAVSLDPILFTDRDTGRTFESQLAANPALNSLTCFTDDDGETWTPSQGGGFGSGIDHQTIGGGAFSPLDPIGPVTPYPNAVVYCSQDIADALCSVSHDGGLTFKPAVPIYTVADCGGLHGHVKVAPDGTIYVPNKNCGGQQGVVVSTDGGLTWSVRRVPGSTAGASDPSVGIGSDGTVYIGYQDSSGHPMAAVSRDRGDTWSTPLDVGWTVGLQNVVFPAVVAGLDDRAAFAFHGTPSPGDFQAANFRGEWHLYVAHTYDGGASWMTVDATPRDPVQRGCIWLRGGSNPCRNLLDFMDATVDFQGRVLVGFADGCIRACVTTPDPAPGSDGYRTQLATIARQSHGPTLKDATSARPMTRR
jgi:hypothetical protein